MKRSKVLVTVVVLVILICGCGAKKLQVPEGYQDLFTGGSFDENMIWTTDDEQYSDLISLLERKCGLVLEGSFLVATDEKVIYAGGWNSIERDGKTQVNPFTTYEIGSVTKQFMAACILQQVQAGNLSTDETIDKYFPEFPHASKITIDNLLHMSSGIVDYNNKPYEFFKNSGVNSREVFYAGDMTDAMILDYMNRTELDFEPGTKMEYCNTNYYLLALILEQVTGQTYEEYMQKNVFDVCGMLNSTCCEVGNITSVPAKQSGGEYMKVGRGCRGAGDIHSSVCDMWLWDRALFANKIIDAEQLGYMLEMQNGYSCGWIEMDGYIEHSGGTIAYACLNTVLQVEGIGNVYVITMTPNAEESYFEVKFRNTVLEYFGQ